MARYRATIDWSLQDGEDFPAGRYLRGHGLAFEHGPEVRGTASAAVVGNKWAEAGAVDPEQLLVAAISSCHMLSFLHAARLAGFVVMRYRDEAEGMLEKSAEGRLAVTRAALRPAIAWGGPAPDAATLQRLHHEAHEACFIANSVKTEIVVEAPGAA
jgi:organic hydroperoxide reductase OsmC/OhrA